MVRVDPCCGRIRPAAPAAACVINFIRPSAMMGRSQAPVAGGRKVPCDISMNDRAQIRRFKLVPIAAQGRPWQAMICRPRCRPRWRPQQQFVYYRRLRRAGARRAADACRGAPDSGVRSATALHGATPPHLMGC
jgi:hypothetical protein